MRRLLAVLALAVVGLAVTGAPALAGGNGGSRTNGGRISVDGGLVVAEGENVDGVVISINGDVHINGTVDGDIYVVGGDLHLDGRERDDVLVIGGDAIVTGRIDGDLIVLGGRAITRGHALVQGDVRSSDEPRVANRKRVIGDVEKVGFFGTYGGMMFTVLAFLWLSVTVSTAVLGLLFVLVFPAAADAVARSGQRIGASIGAGVTVGVIGPVLVVLTVVSLVGVPFGFGLAGLLGALAGLGYVTSSLVLGRRMVKKPGPGGRIGAFFAGFGILRAVAIIPAIGAIVSFAAVVYGLGAVVITAWGASRRASAAPPSEPPTPSEPAAPSSEPAVEAPTESSPVATDDTPTEEHATTEADEPDGPGDDEAAAEPQPAGDATGEAAGDGEATEPDGEKVEVDASTAKEDE